MNKGALIVVEGIDSSGKTTQFDLLYEKLKEKVPNLLVADFPRYYDSEWGKLAGKFLRGDLGKHNELSPFLTALPFMIDEYTWSRDIGSDFIKKGGLILSNRYFTSNVHQISKQKTRARKIYRDWLWRMGYEELGILKPDLVIFLDVSPKIGWNLGKTKKDRAYLRGKKRDIAERDWKHQVASYNEYLYTVRNNKNWVKVNCVKNGKISSVKEIHHQIWKKVSRKLQFHKF